MERRQINAEELNVLFKVIGAGIWHLQNVEDALHTYITVKRDVKTRGAMAAEEAEAILLKHRTRTLGVSTKISRDALVLSPSLQERLERFKEERDWLVHRCVNQHRADLYENKKRYELIRRIESFTEEARAIQKLIGKELEDYVVAQGVNRDWIHRYAENQINKLKGTRP